MKQKQPSEIDFSNIKMAEDQYIKLTIPIYDSDVELIYSIKALEKRIKAVPTSEVLKIINREYTDVMSYGVTYNCPPNIVVYINNCPSYYSFINTLSHEIRHVVDYILYERSFEHISGNNNEAHAYLTGYITEEIMKKIKFVNIC